MDYNELILLSGKAIIFSSLVPLIFGWLLWRKMNKTLRIFWFFLLGGLVLYLFEQWFAWSTTAHTEAWMPFLIQFDIQDTNFLRYFYQLLNFTLLGWFLYRILLPNPVAFGIKYLSATLILLATSNYFFYKGYKDAGGIYSTISALYCFLLPLVSMWYLYSRNSKVPLVHNPYFWINLGLIVPNVVGLFLYIGGDVMYRENFTLYAQLTILKNLIEMIAQLLTAIGFYYARNVKYIDSYQPTTNGTLQQIDRAIP